MFDELSTNLCEGLLRIDAAPTEVNVGGDGGVERVVELGPV